jgi:hypothetical protein
MSSVGVVAHAAISSAQAAARNVMRDMQQGMCRGRCNAGSPGYRFEVGSRAAETELHSVCRTVAYR